MVHGNWMKGIHGISMTEEIQQFVALWQQLQAFDLSHREDEITWKFSLTGSYSSKSAYKMQYAGTFSDFEWAEIWNTKLENKCKIFSWLILQNKLWIVDRILRCGGQANTICSLCHTFPESAAHMADMECLFSSVLILYFVS
jgi:hypothetical protein